MTGFDVPQTTLGSVQSWLMNSPSLSRRSGNTKPFKVSSRSCPFSSFIDWAPPNKTFPNSLGTFSTSENCPLTRTARLCLKALHNPTSQTMCFPHAVSFLLFSKLLRTCEMQSWTSQRFFVLASSQSSFGGLLSWHSWTHGMARINVPRWQPQSFKKNWTESVDKQMGLAASASSPTSFSLSAKGGHHKNLFCVSIGVATVPPVLLSHAESEAENSKILGAARNPSKPFVSKFQTFLWTKSKCASSMTIVFPCAPMASSAFWTSCNGRSRPLASITLEWRLPWCGVHKLSKWHVGRT